MTEGRDYTLPLIAGREGDLLLKVRAVPGSRSDRVLGVHGDALRVAVHAPPERGKANAAVVEEIARWLGVHRSAVALHGGAGSRDKWVRIALGREELIRRMREALAAQ